MATINVTPASNLSTVIAGAANGDIIFLANGVYNQKVICNRSNITLSGASRNGAIIDGTSITLGAYEELIRLRGSNILIENLTVRNTSVTATGAGKGIGSGDSGSATFYNNVVLRNLKIHNIGESAFLFENTTGAIVEDCEIYDITGHYINNRAGNWPVSMIFGRGATGAIMRRCHCYRLYGEAMGFIFGANNGLMEQCIFHEYWAPAYIDSSNNCTFSRNLFYYVALTADPTEQKRSLSVTHENSALSLAQGPMTSAIVENNIMVGWPGAAMTVDRYSGAPSMSGVIIRNNTMVGFGSGSGIIVYGDGITGQIRNNIFYNYNNQSLTGFTLSNNCYNIANTFTGSGDVFADPQLVNPGAAISSGVIDANNYKIASTSPCANAGASLGVTLDYFGNTRT